MILAETPRRKLVTQLVSWGHWFTLLNIIIAITIASIYILNSPSPGTVLGKVYLFINWLSHIGFLTFFAFVILILPLCYLVTNAKLVKALSSIIAAIGLALLAFDALLYNKYAVHLSINSAELIRSEAQTVIAQFGWQQWGFLSLLFLAWLSFQLIAANALWQRIECLQNRKLGRPISGFFVACFVASHAMHVWADANLYQPIVQQDNMFPLSYPATAKTLMARYSLLDIKDYQQRKTLQFNHISNNISYPAETVYCAVETDKKVLLLVLVKEPSPDNIPGLKPFKQHYGLHSNLAYGINSVLYGLPEFYHQALSDYAPLLLSLPQSMGLKVSLYLDPANQPPHLAAFNSDWSGFRQGLQTAHSNLAVGFVDKAQLKTLMTPEVFAEYKIMITSLASQENMNSTLWTNFDNHKPLSSHEDLAPTALNLLGCATRSRAYSTGTNLTDKTVSRYVVSTRSNKVILLNNGQRIEVMTNGNVRIFELSSGNELFDQPDTNLLSQAIKHLSHFSAKRP
jgi:membrane-anchored protein YejM (alkaline phosphatase superfamily)